ncbi:MAG: apolipoprotein N-acyltransferase, partial [Pseudomonadota bacterium]
ISAVIDSVGRVRQHAPLYAPGTLVSALPARTARPLYDRVGDGVWAVMAVLVMGAGLVMGRSAARRP